MRFKLTSGLRNRIEVRTIQNMSWTRSFRELFSEYAVTVTLNVYEYGRGLLDVALRLGLYAALIALFLMILALVVKLLWNCDGDEAGEEDATPNDTRLLLSEKVVFISYGTSEEDLESRKTRSIGGSSPDDLYDDRICAICYDDQKTCLFIPCGHCVSCYTCTNRIINGEIRTCPICRTIIHKVRNLNIHV